MKAAVLKSFGSPLVIEDVPAPVLGTGEVIVDIVATRVLSYTNEVFSGERKYALDLPVIPGAGGIGRVRAIGPDATKLAIGDWVLCDPTVRSRDDAWRPTSPAGRERPRRRRHAAAEIFSRRLVRRADAGADREREAARRRSRRDEAAQWCALGNMLVPYGGFLAAKLQPGETVLVSGATGNFGSAAVAVALAMGAACVVTPGRNETILADLVRRFGERVRPVEAHRQRGRRPRGDEARRTWPDRLRVRHHAALGQHDVVRAAIMTVRALRPRRADGRRQHAGRSRASSCPTTGSCANCITIHGVWMYPPDAATRLIALVRAGLLRLDHYETTDFDLDHANEAVAHAAANAGPFKLTVIRP